MTELLKEETGKLSFEFEKLPGLKLQCILFLRRGGING